MVSSSTTKSGTSLIISETVFWTQLFPKLMLMGHFAPLSFLNHTMDSWQRLSSPHGLGSWPIYSPRHDSTYGLCFIFLELGLNLHLAMSSQIGWYHGPYLLPISFFIFLIALPISFDWAGIPYFFSSRITLFLVSSWKASQEDWLILFYSKHKNQA